MELKATKKTRLETEEGNAEFDPADDSNGSDNDYPEKQKTKKYSCWEGELTQYIEG